MSPPSRFPAGQLIRAAADIFTAAGIPTPAARRVAEALTEADMRGIASHGLMLVPMYVSRLRAGSVNPRTEAEVVSDHGAAATLDARHALGILTSDQAMTLAVGKARSYGVGAVTVRHAFHFGAAFRYVRQAAADGMIGIAASNTRPLMPAPGGATRVVGNNPLAIGVPRAGTEPVVLDMALSQAALGKIRLADAEGREIPPDWAADPSGTPTTDPAKAIAGMLLPVGGPKGFGLALMADILTGVLSGGAFGSSVQGLYSDVTTPNDCAHFFLALNPGAFTSPGEFAASVDELAGQVTGSALAPGAASVLLPGQRAAAAAAAARAVGVTLDGSVIEGLRTTAAELGVTLPDEMNDLDEMSSKERA